MNEHAAYAQSIDSVRNTLDRDDLLRRLPEIDRINDEEVREQTIAYFLNCCPNYFWERPASSSGKYHPPDERDDHGTWLHTKRVYAAYSNISLPAATAGRISDYERALGKAAALTHDTFNYGWPSEQRNHTAQEHDVIAAAMIEFCSPLPIEVAALVHSHMGNWGAGKLPETKNEWLVHTADKSAARSDTRGAVYEPATELLDRWPEIESIDTSEYDPFER